MSSSSIIGYADPLIVSPGARVAIKTSCSQLTFTSKVLRILAGHDHPDAPPVAHQLIESIPQQSHQGKVQISRIGSFIGIPSWSEEALSHIDTLSISFWCQATLPITDHEQFLFSSIDHAASSGFACFIDETGSLLARVGGSQKLQDIPLGIRLARGEWSHINLSIDQLDKKVNVKVGGQAKLAYLGQSPRTFHEVGELADNVRIASGKPLIIASDSEETRVASYHMKPATFNGKIDGFKVEAITGGRVETLLDLDFSIDIPTDQVRDVSGNNHHGILINAPARAVTGHDWNASQNDWTRASYGYGAIHFHDDDLDDATWDTSFELQIPSNLRSGCYGVQVDDGATQDIIPFFVRPDHNSEKAPSVALIMPTFTYIGKPVKSMTAPGPTAHSRQHMRMSIFTTKVEKFISQPKR